jgi:hypothetical protein
MGRPLVFASGGVTAWRPRRKKPMQGFILSHTALVSVIPHGMDLFFCCTDGKTSDPLMIWRGRQVRVEDMSTCVINAEIVMVMHIFCASEIEGKGFYACYQNTFID